MTRGFMLIRDFEVNDIDAIVEILKLNNQYGNPEVDGPEAMKRVKACEAAVFLVCEVDHKVVGLAEESMMVQEPSFIFFRYIPLIKVKALEQR